MTEQHMQIEGIEPDESAVLGLLRRATHKKMRVGQVGMNLTVVNPIQLAENSATLDHFTNGRVFAGFSRGNTPRWTATFGQHINVTATESDKLAADQRNRAVFYENWKIVKVLWTQDHEMATKPFAVLLRISPMAPVFPAGLHSRLIRRWTERPAGHGTW